MRVATLESPVMSGADGSGFMMAVFSRVLSDLSFQHGVSVTPDIYVPTHSPVYGAPLPNGSWSGLVGELVRGRADIAVADLSVTPARGAEVDFATNMFEGRLGILSPRSALELNPTWNILDNEFTRPFSWGVWLLWLFIGILTLSLVSAVAQRPKDVRHAYAYAFFGGTKFVEDTRLGTLLLFSAFAIFSHVLWVAHGARYTASTVLAFRFIHKDLESLARSQSVFAVPRGTSIQTIFLEDRSALMSQLSRKMRLVATNEEGVRGVRNGTFSAFISDSTVVEVYAREAPCTLAPTAVDRGEAGISFAFNPDFAKQPIPGVGTTWLEWFDKVILHMRRSGELQRLLSAHIAESGPCTDEQTNRAFEGPQPLRVTELGPFFTLYAVFVTTAAGFVYWGWISDTQKTVRWSVLGER